MVEIDGIVQIQSLNSFEATIGKLKSTIASRELTIFSEINFSEDAQKAGLKMNPAKLVVFGNPKAGTPIMVATPGIALDFPLKVLVSQDADGKVWVSYTSVEYLKNRYHIPDGLEKNITGIVPIAQSATQM